MVFTVMAALAQMEIEIKRERTTDSVAKRRASGGDLGGRRQQFTDADIRYALHRTGPGRVGSGRVGRGGGRGGEIMRMSRATFYRRIAQLPEEARSPVDEHTPPDV